MPLWSGEISRCASPRLGAGPARPAQADQVEAARRGEHARGAPAGAGRGGERLQREVELEDRTTIGEGGGG